MQCNSVDILSFICKVQKKGKEKEKRKRNHNGKLSDDGHFQHML